MPEDTTPHYNSSKVENFINALSVFSNEFDTYKNSLDTFNHKIETLIRSQENSSVHDELIIKNKSNYFLLTKEDLLFDLRPPTNVNKDYEIDINLEPYSINNLILRKGTEEETRNVYYVPEHASVYNTNNKKTNTIAQVGLNDLSFNDEDGGLIKTLPTQSPAIVNDRLCGLDDVYQCDSHSKMTNKRYYGLNYKDDTNKCGCYVFDDLNSLESKEEEYRLSTLDIPDEKTTNLNYFGVLYDGNLYGLNASKYRNNFKDFYIPRPEKMKKFSSIDTTCNPFTGAGVYGLDVDSFDRTSEYSYETIPEIREEKKSINYLF